VEALAADREAVAASIRYDRRLEAVPQGSAPDVHAAQDGAGAVVQELEAGGLPFR